MVSIYAQPRTLRNTRFMEVWLQTYTCEYMRIKYMYEYTQATSRARSERKQDFPNTMFSCRRYILAMSAEETFLIGLNAERTGRVAIQVIKLKFFNTMLNKFSSSFLLLILL